MPTIKDLNEATQIQIELMKFETRYANEILSNGHTPTAEEIDDIKELLERNPAYVANAYNYLPEVIDNATSKKQIIMAWVHGECKDAETAHELFDIAMSSNLSIANARKAIREANGKDKPKTGPKCKRCQRLDEFIQHRDFVHVAELREAIDQ